MAVLVMVAVLALVAVLDGGSGSVVVTREDDGGAGEDGTGSSLPEAEGLDDNTGLTEASNLISSRIVFGGASMLGRSAPLTMVMRCGEELEVEGGGGGEGRR